MARKVRIKVNHAGVRELLNSGEVISLLNSTGERVLNAANAAVPERHDAAYGEPFDMQTYSGGARARTYIRTNSYDGRHAEARDGVLTKALGGS